MKKVHISHLATAGGIAAILLWSTTVAVVRSLSEQVGPVTAAAAVYSVSGIVALISLLINGQKRGQILKLPASYLIGCGLLFLGYMLLLFLAIGWAHNRQEVLEVGLLNYLWPTLMLVFSLVFLGKKANWILVPGSILALVGVFLVLTQETNYVSLQSFSRNFLNSPVVYSLALAAALSWAMYSNLTSRWAGGLKEGAVILFLPVTAVVLVLIRLFTHEPGKWGVRSMVEVLFLGVATFAAYALWDNAMRRGNVTVVAAASYLTPFFSTIVSCLYLAVVPGGKLWAGCCFLILGSALSWRAISDNSNRDFAR